MLIFVTLLQVTKDNEFQFGPFSYVYYLSYIFFYWGKLVVTMALYTLCLVMIYLPLMF